MNILKKRFIDGLQGIEVQTETELLERIASEQGHDEYVTVDQSVIDEIFNDKRTIDYLLENELEDIQSDLISVYCYAEEGALNNEYYKEVWGELTGSYFDGKPQWFSRPHRYNKEKIVEYVKLEISDFEGVILDFLSNGKGYTDGTLNYWGSFLGILKDIKDCLRLRFPEYAHNIDEYINDGFESYF